MDHAAIEALYRQLVEDFEEADRWTFKQNANDHADLLVDRAQKMLPIVEKAAQVFENIMPFCEAPAPDAEANNFIAQKIASLVDLEQRLAIFLRNPLRHDEIVAYNKEASQKAFYAAAFRTFRYMVWTKRHFTVAADIKESGVAAVLRVKNEIHNLRIMLPILVAYFDEIIVIDHNSTDGTYEYVAQTNHAKIKLFRYTVETARAGEFYASELKSGKGSLADYYNFAFAQATAAYVCKWDADMYPLPTLAPLLNSVRAHTCDVGNITGVDCYGLTSCSLEPRLYKRALGLKYIDIAYYEELDTSDESLRTGSISTPVYLHIKQDSLLKM